MRTNITEAQFCAWVSKMIVEGHDPEHTMKLVQKKLRDMQYLDGVKKPKFGINSARILLKKEEN